MVWADANGNGGFDNGETVIRYAQAHGQMDITGSNAAAIAFDSRGRRIANADQVLTLRPDECGGQPLQRKLTIKATGQTSIEKEACS